MSEIRSGSTSDTKQTVKESPSTHRDLSVKHASKPLRQGEVTRQLWLSTSQTDTPNFSESSQNDRLANVIINMNTPIMVTHIQPNTSLHKFSDKRFSPSPNFD